MDKKLLWSILTVIPFINIIAAIIYLLTLKPSGKEAIVVILGIIPFLNLICGIILVLNALGTISLA